MFENVKRFLKVFFGVKNDTPPPSPSVPFCFPSCLLDSKEYAKIISEINTNYDLYRNESFAIHFSVGLDDKYYIYYFENRGFNDYNIVEKFEF